MSSVYPPRILGPNNGLKNLIFDKKKSLKKDPLFHEADPDPYQN